MIIPNSAWRSRVLFLSCRPLPVSVEMLRNSIQQVRAKEQGSILNDRESLGK